MVVLTRLLQSLDTAPYVPPMLILAPYARVAWDALEGDQIEMARVDDDA